MDANKESKLIAVIFAVIAILCLGCLVFLASAKIAPSVNPESDESLRGQPVAAPPEIPNDDTSLTTNADFEAAMKIMEPKLKALMLVAQKLTKQDGSSPTEQRIMMLMFQAMKLHQLIIMMASDNSVRSQVRTLSCVGVMSDIINEAYEEARKAGLLENPE